MSTAHERPFAPEPTPLLADVPPPVKPVAADAADEWVGEKTILIPDDEPTSVFLNVGGTDGWLAIREFPAVIGRHERAAVTLDDPSVSRRHAQIAMEEDGTLVVEDLGSSNGIRVEGQRVERMLLMDGDRFELGRITLQFSTKPPGHEGPAPAVAQVASAPAAQKYDPGHQFDFKKFLPLAVSVVAVAVALAMFANRTPRTVVLPDAPAERALTAVMPTDRPLDQAASPGPAAPPMTTSAEPLTPGNIDEAPGASTSGPGVTTTPASATQQGAAQKTAPAAEQMKRVGSTASAGAPEAGQANVQPQAAAKPRAMLPTAKAPPAAKPDRPVKAPFQEELAAAPKANSRPPRPAGKPKPVRRSSEFSRAYIDTALQMYLDGDSENAIRRLGIMSRSLRNQRQFREEAAGLQLQIEALVDNYKQGQSALDRGDRAAAAGAWARFLRDEAQLFGDSTSVFAKRIGRVVAEQYIRDGDKANAEGRFHDAYLSWTKALQYEPDGVAKESLERLKQRAQELYREGYRLESVNLERAMAIWVEVTELLPPGTEYHTKARAKLRWHQQGARGR